MGIYRCIWLQLMVFAAVCGCTAAGFVLPVDALAVYGVGGALTVAVFAGVARSHARERCSHDERRRATPSTTAALAVGVLAGVGCIAVAGLIALFHGVALLLFLVLGVSAPASLRRAALRSLLHALNGDQAADPTAEALQDTARPGDPIGRPTGTFGSGGGGSATPPCSPEASAPALSSLPNPDQCALLAEVQLCWWWRVSFVKLQKAASPVQRTAIIETRRALLDELADRDPQNFARWLASGARAASDPARFFTATRRR